MPLTFASTNQLTALARLCQWRPVPPPNQCDGDDSAMYLDKAAKVEILQRTASSVCSRCQIGNRVIQATSVTIDLTENTEHRRKCHSLRGAVITIDREKRDQRVEQHLQKSQRGRGE